MRWRHARSKWRHDRAEFRPDGVSEAILDGTQRHDGSAYEEHVVDFGRQQPFDIMRHTAHYENGVTSPDTVVTGICWNKSSGRAPTFRHSAARPSSTPFPLLVG